MPYGRRPNAQRRGLCGKPGDGLEPGRGERPSGIDLRADGVAVMNEVNHCGGATARQRPAYARSPAGMRTFSRFSGNGSGQVVYGLNAQGGLYASLKSTTTRPSS